MTFLVELSLVGDLIKVAREPSWNFTGRLAAVEALVSGGHLPRDKTLLVNASVIHGQKFAREPSLNSEQGKGALQTLLGLRLIELSLTLLRNKKDNSRVISN
jgi:hypothetical protein